MGAAPDQTLVAAVGNRWLKDQGFGMHVVDRLNRVSLPSAVDVVSWECGTIAAFQQLCDREYRRAVFLGAVARGRTPGTLHQTRSHLPLPDEAEIHGRVADSVMGLVSLDNLLFISRYYRRVPDEVLLIEAEPADETWGDQLSPRVAALVTPAVDAVLTAIESWPPE